MSPAQCADLNKMVEVVLRGVHREVAAVSVTPAGEYVPPHVRWIPCHKIARSKDADPSADWECCRLIRMIHIAGAMVQTGALSQMQRSEMFQVRSAVSDPKRNGRFGHVDIANCM